MARTDKTRPWHVQIADRPGVWCVAVHDHRDGKACELPDNPGQGRRDDFRTRNCHWDGSNV